MDTAPRTAHCLPLIGAQAIVAFNDNAAKFILAGLASATLAAEAAQRVNGLLALLLVLPFVLMAPLAGWLADRFSKTLVIRWSLLAQMAGLAVVYLGTARGSLAVAVVGFALLALQSSIFSPAKHGILKELVGPRRLGLAVGAMELTSVLAILLGGFAGGFAFDWVSPRLGGGEHGTAAALTVAVLAVLALAAYAVFLPVRRTTASLSEAFTPTLLVRHLQQIRGIWAQRTGLRLPALGVAFGWSAGSLLVLTLLEWSSARAEGAIGTASSAGWLTLVLGLGVAGGCGLGALRCRHHIDLGLTPVGFALMGLGLLAGARLAEVPGALESCLLVAGLGAGLFLVPLNARIQERSHDTSRGRNLAGANLLVNLATIGSVGLYLLLSQGLGAGPVVQLAVVGLGALALAGYAGSLLRQQTLRFLLRPFLLLCYRVRVRGLEFLPRDGGVLLVCNHIAYVDAVLMALVSPRPLRFLAMPELLRWPLVRHVVQAMGVIPTSPERARSCLDGAVEALRNGEVVCVFPEGALTRSGAPGELKRGFEVIARRAGAPVMPVHLDGLWGSIFSFRYQRWIWKWPRRLPYPVRVTFAPPMESEHATVENVREALLDMGAHAMEQRPELQRNLGRVLLATLKAEWKRELIADHAQGRRALGGGRLLVASLALARHIQRTVPEERVGVVFPPGIGGSIANFAIALAGKSAVNLNVTLGPEGMRSCIDRAGLTTVITAEAVVEKVAQRYPNLPWPEKRIDLPAFLKSQSKARLAVLALAAKVLPVSALAGRLGLPENGGEREAAVLFSSGSVGRPKGVVLSHRNILAQKEQIDDTDILPRDEVALASLPIFHSFGFTVLLWYATLAGVKIAAVPSPLDLKSALKAIEDEGVSVLLGSPTFLRPYLKKADPQTMRTVKWVIAGAEKTPEGFAERWQERFPESLYLEGYGLTETSPVVAVNLPDVPDKRTGKLAPRSKPGTVGKLFSGMAARVRNPETDEPLGLGQQGVLLLKGPNVFQGYLGEPELTRESFDNDGWFISGDLARLDKDGFVTIDGRLSRFSKIGGEMVPHGTIEEAIQKAFDLEDREEPAVAVTARPDPDKGEALTCFTTEAAVTREALFRRLSEAGLPNLWIPREVRKVERIPVLASGKLNLKSLRDQAREDSA